MNTKKTMLAALLAAAAAGNCAAASCTLDGLRDVKADHPLCYFYTGTEGYRAKDFAKAAANWKQLVALNTVPVELKHLKTGAYNNLGYLYFFGLGVKPDKKAALTYWEYASKAGEEESTYHLCHAYADRDEASYAPKRAVGYCKEALRRYALIKEPHDGSATIVAQLNTYLRQLQR